MSSPAITEELPRPQDPPPISQVDVAAIAELVARMERAWNSSNGQAFAADFLQDADFVNVYGVHITGRAAIARGHDQIFHSIYAGSQVCYQLAKVRVLCSGTAVAHVRARLRVPCGPTAGEHEALPSLVLTRQTDRWKIAAFHNTFVSNP